MGEYRVTEPNPDVPGSGWQVELRCGSTGWHPVSTHDTREEAEAAAGREAAADRFDAASL